MTDFFYQTLTNALSLIEWSPHGYHKALELFQRGFYDNSHFFRVVPGFLVQFGMSYTSDHDLMRFSDSKIHDDPKHDPPIPFREGILSYAGSGPNSRTSQLFVSYGSASSLGREPWETPIGEVIEGIKTLRGLYSDYGDMPPWGKGPIQHKIRTEGAKYISENYPQLDSFKTCTVSNSLEKEEKGTRLGSPMKQDQDVVSDSAPTEEEYLTQNVPFIVGGITSFVVVACLIFSILQRRHRKNTKTT